MAPKAWLDNEFEMDFEKKFRCKIYRRLSASRTEPKKWEFVNKSSGWKTGDEPVMDNIYPGSVVIILDARR